MRWFINPRGEGDDFDAIQIGISEAVVCRNLCGGFCVGHPGLEFTEKLGHLHRADYLFARRTGQVS